jgi:hypothetical protein
MGQVLGFYCVRSEVFVSADAARIVLILYFVTVSDIKIRSVIIHNFRLDGFLLFLRFKLVYGVRRISLIFVEPCIYAGEFRF